MSTYYAVIGDPVAHSLSPVIQATLFEKHSINASYLRLRIPKERPGLIPDAIYMLSLSGFNVTMPHKETVLTYIDELDGSAGKIGCANTVVMRGGKLYGYNTDGDGFAMGLSLNGRSFTGEDAVFLGAGGAVRALACKAAEDGAKSVRIMCRCENRGKMVAETVRKGTGSEVSVSPFDLTLLSKIPCTLLINGTPLGMAGTGRRFENLDFLKSLSKDTLVCDLIYRPGETQLLAEAKKLGLSVHGGLPMLICQALIAFRHFTGAETGLSDYYMISSILKEKYLS